MSRFSSAIGCLWVAFGLHLWPSTSWSDEDAIRPSVVKVFSTQRTPDLIRPWTKSAPRDVSGTGFVIEGNRILTNAHVVSYAGQIYVQAYQSAEKISAKVESISLSIDLAVLTVEGDEFYKDRPPLKFHENLPRVKEKVNVYGYPIGGDELSVTQGITSPIEYTSYYQDTSGLRIQIDAAINPGNSGGPAISDNKVIGVAFAGLSKAENIGYLIPVVEIATFLEDVKDGKYDGKPQLWDETQSTENDALRQWLKMPNNLGGCIVLKLHQAGASEALKIHDVITHIGPHSLDRSGNVRLSDDLQVKFNYYIPQFASAGVVPLTLFREGQSVQANVPVSSKKRRLITYLDGAYPPYFIIGPLVFSTVRAEFVMAIASEARGSAPYRGEQVHSYFGPMILLLLRERNL